MIKRRILIQLLALMVVLPATAVADNLPALPVPKITDAPKSMPEGPSRMVHFSFAATPQSVSDYLLNERVQQWFCPPGKDNPPAGDALPTPWPGQQAYCQLEENSGGVSQVGSASISSDRLMFPVRGEPHLGPGTWYLRVRLFWANVAGTNGGSGGWSAWHRTLVVAAHADTGSYTGTFAGTKTARADHSHVNTINIAAKIAERSKPPVFMAPTEGRVYHGGPINFSGSLDQHDPNGDWACCDIEWKRAVILAPENRAYAQAHTPGQTAFPTPPMQWNGKGVVAYGLASNVKEPGPSFHGHFLYNDLRPHDGAFGYRYWFRLREYFYPGGISEMMKFTIYTGPWSAWRSFTVQEPEISRVMPPGSMHVRPGAHMGKSSSGQQQNSGQHNTRRVAPMPMMRLK